MSVAQAMLPRLSARNMTSSATPKVSRQISTQAVSASASINRSKRRVSRSIAERPESTAGRAIRRERRGRRLVRLFYEDLLQLGDVLRARLLELGPVDVIRLLLEVGAELDDRDAGLLLHLD